MEPFWILIFSFSFWFFIFSFSSRIIQADLKGSSEIEMFKKISEKLVCQCSCLMMLSVCNHENCPSAIPMRKEIESAIMEGRTQDEIIKKFIDTYGMKILSSPPAHGFNILAWVMPGVIGILGFIFIILTLKSLKRKRKIESSHPSLNQDIDKRIEEELDEWKK